MLAVVARSLDYRRYGLPTTMLLMSLALINVFAEECAAIVHSHPHPHHRDYHHRRLQRYATKPWTTEDASSSAAVAAGYRSLAAGRISARENAIVRSDNIKTDDVAGSVQASVRSSPPHGSEWAPPLSTDAPNTFFSRGRALHMTVGGGGGADDDGDDARNAEDVTTRTSATIQSVGATAMYGKTKKKALHRPFLMNVFENNNASPAAESTSRYFPLGLHHRHFAVRTETADDGRSDSDAEDPIRTSTFNKDESRRIVFSEYGGVTAKSNGRTSAGRGYANNNNNNNMHKHRGPSHLSDVGTADTLADSHSSHADDHGDESTSAVAAPKISMEALRECLFLRSGCVDPRRQHEERARTSAYLDKVQALMLS